jgi:hypothetical protein
MVNDSSWFGIWKKETANLLRGLTARSGVSQIAKKLFCPHEGHKKLPVYGFDLAGDVRLELTASGFGGQHSIQLS